MRETEEARALLEEQCDLVDNQISQELKRSNGKWPKSRNYFRHGGSGILKKHGTPYYV